VSAPILVTGGSGFLGEHVVAALVQRGANPVRVLVRGTYEPELPAGVEVHKGDVVDGPGLAEALAGCEQVVHLAGLVSRDPGAAAAMMRVHVEGTRRLLRAAREAGVRRVLVASTSGTVAVSREPEPIPDEDAGYATDVVAGWPYYLSKIYQEKEALALGKQLGLEVVVVNPSLLLGPGDRRLSSTGDVLRFLRREIPVVPRGGVSFVDVRDAADAVVAALDRGRPGRRYLLGGPNWSFAEFFGRLSRASKVAPPRLQVPDRWARVGASVLEAVAEKLGRSAPVDRVSVEMSQVYWYCDSTRATRELSFTPRDPGETLDETIRWLRRNHRI